MCLWGGALRRQVSWRVESFWKRLALERWHLAEAGLPPPSIHGASSSFQEPRLRSGRLCVLSLARRRRQRVGSVHGQSPHPHSPLPAPNISCRVPRDLGYITSFFVSCAVWKWVPLPRPCWSRLIQRKYLGKCLGRTSCFCPEMLACDPDRETGTVRAVTLLATTQPWQYLGVLCSCTHS